MSLAFSKSRYFLWKQLTSYPFYYFFIGILSMVIATRGVILSFHILTLQESIVCYYSNSNLNGGKLLYGLRWSLFLELLYQGSFSMIIWIRALQEPLIIASVWEQLYQQLSRLDYSFFLMQPSSTIQSAAKEVQLSFEKFYQSLFKGAIQKSMALIIVLLRLYYKDFQLGRIAFLFALCFLFTMLPLYMSHYRNAPIKKANKIKQQILGSWGEVIEQIRNVWAYGQVTTEANHMKNKIEQQWAPIAEWSLYRSRIIHFIGGVIYLFFSCSLIYLFLYKLSLVDNGIPISAAGEIFSLTIHVMSNLWMTIFILSQFSTLQGELEAALDFFNDGKVQSKQILTAAVPCIPKVASIDFNQLTYAYKKGTPILEKISLHIAAGEKIGIKGESGKGKSTLTHLLLAHIEPTEGDIRLGNQSYRLLSKAVIRKTISYLPQQPFLWLRSIRENLCYGLYISEKEMIATTQLVGIHKEILDLPKGYDTIVDATHSLSGGQKQRILLVRCLLKESLLYILDEPTAALDNSTEAKAMTAIEQFMKKQPRATWIIISHKQGVLQRMDRVLEIKDRNIWSTTNA